MATAIKIDHRDNVAVALSALQIGDVVTIAGHSSVLNSAVPQGHKFALDLIPAGAVITKYGHSIGIAKQAIIAGTHVHEHNMQTALDGLERYVFTPKSPVQAYARAPKSFKGYRRRDGRVGTRNDIWIIPTVGCVANVCDQIAQRTRPLKPNHIDDIVALTHPYGCSQLGDDLTATRKILASLSAHPNAGGVVFVGLGCESNQLSALLAEAGHDETGREGMGSVTSSRVRTVMSQSAGDEIEAGVQAVKALFDETQNDRREDCGVSELVVGLKCGGSDAFSGLTANPLLGRLTDRVCASSGSAILTEIPEIFGAEREFFNRAVNADVFERAVSLVNRFKQYFLDHNQPVYENPSPGNKEGGITTLEEKSLGAVQKGGQAALSDVIAYGERATSRGLTLLEAPGNDAVSSTALAAAGATVILFTTGRGTPLGFPVPTIKVSTNADLSRRKPNWIDFDASQCLTQVVSEDVDEAFLSAVLNVASGLSTANERNAEKSIAIWKRGVTL